MEYGEILAKTYQLPDRQRQPLGGGMRQPNQQKQREFNYADYGLDKAPEGLQFTTPDIAKRTQGIYQEWAAMRKFAKDMWINDGVDIMAPDPSNPDAIWAAEAFKQRLGTLMADIDASKQGADLAKSRAAAQGRNEVLPVSTTGNSFFSEMQPGQFQTPTGLTDAAQQFITKEQGVLNVTPEQANQLNVRRDAMIQQYEALKAQDPANAGMYDQQIFALRQQQATPAENPAYRPSAWEFNFGQKQKAGFNEIKRIVNHQRGIWDKATTSNFYDQGTYWLENRDFEGTDIGSIPYTKPNGEQASVNATIEKAVENPATGEIRWVFKESGIPPMRIDNLPTKTVANYLKGINRAAVDEFLASTPQAVDERGNIIQDLFIDPASKQKSVKTKAPVAETASAETAAAQQEVQTLQALRNSGFWSWVGGLVTGKDATVERDSQYGKIKLTKVGDNQFAIENIRDLFPGQAEEYYQRFEKLTGEQIPSVLKQFGIQPAQSGGTTYTPRQQSAIGAFRTQFNREPTPDELQKILTKFQ